VKGRVDGEEKMMKGRNYIGYLFCLSSILEDGFYGVECCTLTRVANKLSKMLTSGFFEEKSKIFK
jgi:hypothetical protein